MNQAKEIKIAVFQLMCLIVVPTPHIGYENLLLLSGLGAMQHVMILKILQ